VNAVYLMSVFITVCLVVDVKMSMAGVGLQLFILAARKANYLNGSGKI
jgi:hypothetical protein